MTMLKYRKNVYSQNGEDGILEEVIKQLNIHNGTFVEFGAWDGKYLSNTYYFYEKFNFSGVYIESDSEKFKELKNLCDSSNNKLSAINSIVSEKDESSLDFLLNKTELRHDFDILSIDIDGNDYMVWKSFNNYKPKIVIIEANSAIPNDIEYVGREIIESDRSIVEGSSCLSLLKLGVEKGYNLICHTGNMIFVRDDLIDKCNLITDEEKNNPECLFLNSWKRPWNKELSKWK